MDKLSLLTPEQFMREKQAVTFIPGIHEYVAIRVESGEEAEEAYNLWEGRLYRATDVVLHTLETMLTAFHNMVFSFDSGEPAIYFHEENLEEASRLSELYRLRCLRAPLLAAFDVYKSNVMYGVISETQETRSRVLDWYRRCLDLDGGAISQPPAEIARYVRVEE